MTTQPANALGALTVVKAGAVEYRYTSFDAMGRAKSSEQVIEGQSYPGMEYGYDLAGDLISEKYPSGRVVTYSLDDFGRLGKVSGQMPGQAMQIYASDFGYAPQGEIEKMRLGNGLWEHTLFDPKRLQVIQVGLGISATDSGRLQIDYDYGTTTNNGSVKSQSITYPGLAGTLKQTYTYDSLSRLKITEEASGATRQWIQTFKYDRFGNRSADASLDGSGQPKTTPSLVGPNPQIDAGNNRIRRRDNSAELYKYDDAGNLVMDRDGNSFTYDGENRQAKYFTPSDVVTPAAVYTYDADGRRVKKQVGGQVTHFVYDAVGQLVAEYSNASPAGSGTRYVTPDALGSPRVITDKDGVARDRQDYLPFGEDIPAAFGRRGNVQAYGGLQSRQRFAGYELDAETQLSFAKSRYYANAAGRFNSVDPLISSASLNNPQTFNRYAYCGNNPVNRADPSGMDWYYNPQKLRNGYWEPEWYDSQPLGYVDWIFGNVYYSGEDCMYHLLDPFSPKIWDFVTEAEANAKLDELFNAKKPAVPKGYPSMSAAPAEDDETGPTGLLVDYLLGLGPKERHFGPSAHMTQEMMTSPDVATARSKFIEQGGGRYGPTGARFGLNAEDGPFRSLFHPTREFVGSFTITITEATNGDSIFELHNTTGLNSALYHIPGVNNVERTTMAPLSNQVQTYFWIERGLIRR